jgi:hypothetical protein
MSGIRLNKGDAEQGLREEGRGKRPARVPFGGLSYKLEVKHKDPAYWYYWFRNRGDEVERAKAAGYEFVSRRQARGAELPEELTLRDVDGGNQSLDDRYERFGGRDEFGRDYTMVLMRQPMEYHLEDHKADQAAADRIDEAIFRQEFKGQSVSQKYGQVSVTHKVGD